MMKHMEEILNEEKKDEDSKKNAAEKEIRTALKAEIDELQAERNKGIVQFLKLISEKYVSYQGKKVEFTEDQLKSQNLKNTLKNVTKHYHPDKKVLAQGKMTEKELYLRDEIIKITNILFQEMKGSD